MRKAFFALVFAALGLAHPAAAQFAGQASFAGTASGSANALALTVSNVTSYAQLQGVRITFMVASTNTSPDPTININGLGAVVTYDGAGNHIATGSWLAGTYHSVLYTPSSIFVDLTEQGFLNNPTVLGNADFSGGTAFTYLTGHGQIRGGSGAHGIDIGGAGQSGGCDVDLYNAAGSVALCLKYNTLLLELPGYGAGFLTTDSVGNLTTVSNIQVGVPGAFSGLEVQTTGNAATTITANAVTLVNSSGLYVTASAVSCAINETTTGAGGLDTGSLAASTVYNYWLISTGSGTNCEASLQSTANSTFLSHLPSGYTYYARVGADLTNSASQLWRVVQSGRRAHLVLGTNPATPPLLASGSSSGWTAISTAAFAPPSADAIFANLSIGAGSSDIVYVGSNTSGSSNATCGATQPSASSANMNFYCDVGIEGGDIAWDSNTGAGNVGELGWEDNL